MRARAVADRRASQDRARGDRRHRMEVGEPVIEKSHRVGVALSLARGPEHGADERHGIAMPGRDQNVTRISGVSSLDTVDPRYLPYQGVSVDDIADVVPGSQHCASKSHDTCEVWRVREVVAGQLD